MHRATLAIDMARGDETNLRLNMDYALTEHEAPLLSSQGLSALSEFPESQVKEMLDDIAQRVNRPEFTEADPVQFPRMFSDKRDIEIASLLAATLAWGNRRMICNDCRKMFALMDWQPYRYTMEEGYEDLPEMNIHRTFFAKNLKHYLRGLRAVYQQYPSLEDFAAAVGVTNSETPSWHLAAALNDVLTRANSASDSRCLPLNLHTTALKRLNMALRWLARDDGIVDMGVWTVLKPSQLFIPLDVHVGNVSRQLGLLTRKSDDRTATIRLTEKLRTFRPDDPVYYDYALFGIGVGMKSTPDCHGVSKD